MESLSKRQRLYSPIAPAFPQSFDSEEAYYDEDSIIVDDEEEDIEEPPPDLDPESEFQQKRARLDYKLKSTFEAIFEKYGRNFDGVGDEIDLATGEIVVNNGHILEMLDERDTGDVDGTQSVPTDGTEESGDLPNSIMETISDSDEEEDEDEGSDDESGGEILEDDLILRGFALANRFSRPSPELESLKHPTGPSNRPPTRPSTSHPQLPGPFERKSKTRLPTQSEILTQFGPQLGPRIFEYVSRQSVPKDSAREPVVKPKYKSRESVWTAPDIPAFHARDNAVEPTWRAPEIPAFKPRRHEVKEPVVYSPEPELPPSPEETTSIWALPQKRGRKKKPSISSIAHMGGESSGARQREEYAHGPADYSARMEDNVQASPVKKTRRRFTEEDDQILFNWVTRATQQGLMLNHSFWRRLEAKHPTHSWSSWEYRYKHHFTYLSSNSAEESEVSLDEPSIDSEFVAPQNVPSHRPDISLNQDPPRSRPERIRRPAQKDSRIISWSEAVDALEYLDPEIHAGVMHGAGIMETSNPGFSQSHVNHHRRVFKPSDMIQPTKQSTRPKSPPKEVIDLTDDLPDTQAVSPQEHPFIPRESCPHAGCKHLPTVMYRLQRRENEELSEMILHLFRVHRTTPYPCGEINCRRQREEGYFMQADLVRHVRKDHPTIGALQRLRGRVDSELLDRDVELGASPRDLNNLSDRPFSQPRDSDFMSPRKFPGRRTSSSHQASSADLDQTPRASTTIPAMSRSTPMTSVSSMRVHHSSGIKDTVEEEVEDNNMHYMKYIDDISMRAQRSTRGVSDRQSLNNLQPPAPKVLPSLKGKEKEDASSSRNSLPTPITSTSSFSDSIFSFFGNNSRQQRQPLEQQQQSASSRAAPEAEKPASTIAETPDPASPQVQKRPQVMLSTTSATQVGPKTKQLKPPQHIQRNTLEPAYEFSDEEQEPEPQRVVKAADTQTFMRSVVPKQPVPSSSMGPPSSINPHRAVDEPTYNPKKLKRVMSSASRHTFATPTARKAIRQSLLRMALDAEDFDELSLDKDDVVLLSSQPRRHQLSSTGVTIKQEGVMNTPRPLASTCSKKRPFSSFQDRSSPDELAAPEVSPSRAAQIKAEDEIPLPQLPRPMANHRRGVKYLGLPPSQRTPSSTSIQMAIRTNTPLLNLTPTHHSTEILDSTAEESSPPLPTHPPTRPRNKRQRTATASESSSPMANLLTPTKKRIDSADLLKAAQAPLTFRSPGGTFRSCGKDDFKCGRSFCFPCGRGFDTGIRPES